MPMADKTVSLPSGRKVKVRQRVKRVKQDLPKVTLPPPHAEPNITVQSDPAAGEALKEIQKDGMESIRAMRAIEQASAATRDLVQEIRDSMDRGNVTLSIEVTERDGNDNISSVTVTRME